MYDFINLGKKGVNWASNLASYNHILNEESKEELEWNSPFEVYFGRKSNILVKASLENVADLNDCIIKAPKRKDYQRHFRNVKKLRKSPVIQQKNEWKDGKTSRKSSQNSSIQTWWQGFGALQAGQERKHYSQATHCSKRNNFKEK